MTREVEADHLAEFVKELGGQECETAIVLGSGLIGLSEDVEIHKVVDYCDIPGFSRTSVPGHGGQLIFGRMAERHVAVFLGRFHFYEGFNAYQASVTVRLARALGCDRILLTCAAGGIRSEMAPGDSMIVSDHLNLMGDNPLRGLCGDSFIDLSGLYDRSFLKPLQAFAASEGIPMHSGVLAAMAGPSYETPAEISMLERLGADAVSMSVVPEAIMARYVGMKVAALAFISNAAAGLSKSALNHQDVLAQGRKGCLRLRPLIREILSLWHGDPA